jgi:hypothetical protein
VSGICGIPPLEKPETAVSGKWTAVSVSLLKVFLTKTEWFLSGEKAHLKVLGNPNT